MILKVLVLGDYGTGKSTIFSQFLNNVPGAERRPSIKLDLIEFKRTIKGKEVTVNLYDIPGRELTSDNRSKHYKNTCGAIIIFDISRPDSFRHAPFWLEELMNYSGIGKVPILLVGNKSDLRETSQRTLNPIDAKEYVFRLNRTTRVDGVENHFVELSAKAGKGLVMAIDMLVESMIKHQEALAK
jgi:small GTP-binding protein